MAKFNEEFYKGFTIGHWIGDNSYFVYPTDIKEPIIGENVLIIKKTKNACKTFVDNYLIDKK